MTPYADPTLIRNRWNRLMLFTPCLTPKDFLGKEKRNFLINRTEHPRLAERVRCLCVGCDATWGPPCQALVTRLSANRRRQTEGDRLEQNSSNNTNNTVHNRFIVVRREAYVHG